MISVEEDLIDAVTAAFHHLQAGKVPPPVSIPPGLPENEIRQLLTYVNAFLTEYRAFAEAMERMARGELDARPLSSRMDVVHSFKTLQSNLRHLTWKTQAIASGDLGQRINFMGDFSAAFNSMARQLKESREKLVELNEELEIRNRFIRKTFGRFTGHEIVEALLDAPDGLKLGGEKREVTLLMSDLRGFTVLSESREPAEVVAVLNHYLTAMVEVIRRRGGTIDEIIGDAVLVIFGAPQAVPDAAYRAVCCALEMQAAMGEVNEFNRRTGWPELEMGIALHTGDVVAGNIGSVARSKYAVVGHAVNLTARIESFTIGGQVLVSPALVRAAGAGLVLGDAVDVHAKGMKDVLRCRELIGHEDHPHLVLEKDGIGCLLLAEPAALQCVRLTEKHLDELRESAALIALSPRRCVIAASSAFRKYENILLRMEGAAAGEGTADFYAKVIRTLDEERNHYLVHFTAVPPPVRDLLCRLGENACLGLSYDTACTAEECAAEPGRRPVRR